MKTSFSSRRLERGMSLVEIIVGVAIALVATLVMFQVFSSSNSSNRATAAGNEAQISGNIGMYQLERDLKVAGMGFGTLSNAGGGCSVTALNPALPTSSFSFPLVPVLITPGAGGVPDQIDVLYGSSAYMTVGRRYSAGTTVSKTTVASGGIQLGDLAILTDSGTPPTACELVEITAKAVDALTVEHRQGSGSGYTNFTTGALVATATHNSAGTPAGLNGTGWLYDLGTQPALNQWRIASNSLSFANVLGDGLVAPVAEGVVHLKAQYGVDDGAGGAVAGDGIISPSEWTSSLPANFSQVLAVRFALLARSPQMEKTAVSVAPTWTGGSFDMSAMPSDWPNYRYRVYESVVAMRNLIWGTSP